MRVYRVAAWRWRRCTVSCPSRDGRFLPRLGPSSGAALFLECCSTLTRSSATGSQDLSGGPPSQRSLSLDGVLADAAHRLPSQSGLGGNDAQASTLREPGPHRFQVLASVGRPAP